MQRPLFLDGYGQEPVKRPVAGREPMRRERKEVRGRVVGGRVGDSLGDRS